MNKITRPFRSEKDKKAFMLALNNVSGEKKKILIEYQNLDIDDPRRSLLKKELFIIFADGIKIAHLLGEI